MRSRTTPPDPARQARILADLRRDQNEREKSYRAQALKIFPHLCGRCGREFSGKRLRELTVHHKDHDFRNNPPDGSNWELLCLYCHDDEHEKFRMKGQGAAPESTRGAASPISTPFAGLDGLLTPPASEADNAKPSGQNRP